MEIIFNQLEFHESRIVVVNEFLKYTFSRKGQGRPGKILAFPLNVLVRKLSVNGQVLQIFRRSAETVSLRKISHQEIRWKSYYFTWWEGYQTYGVQRRYFKTGPGSRTFTWSFLINICNKLPLRDHLISYVSIIEHCRKCFSNKIIMLYVMGCKALVV